MIGRVSALLPSLPTCNNARSVVRGGPLAKLDARLRRAASALAVCLGCVVALSLVGCASKPTMTVRQAQVSGVGLTGVLVHVTVQIHNPNSFDVMVRSVRSSVTLANRWTVGPNEHQPNVWLPAGAQTLVTAPVVIPWPLVLPLLAETLGSETIPYHMQGTADITATRLLGIQVNNEPIDERGVIPRAMILSAARTTYPNAQ